MILKEAKKFLWRRLCAFMLIFSPVFSGPVSADWVNCQGLSIWVDGESGLKHAGTMVHYASNQYLVFVDAATDRLKNCVSVGPGWQMEGIRNFDVGKGSKKLYSVVELRSGDIYRHFDIETGQELFFQEDRDKDILASDKLPDSSTGDPVPMLQSFGGAESKISLPEYRLITDRAEWNRLWARHAGEGSLVPDVDFVFNMAVAIFAGKVMNGQAVQPLGILESKEAITLDYTLTLYQDPDGLFYARPFGIFVIPNSTKKLIIRENMLGQMEGISRWETRKEFPPG